MRRARRQRRHLPRDFVDTEHRLDRDPRNRSRRLQPCVDGPFARVRARSRPRRTAPHPSRPPPLRARIAMGSPTRTTRSFSAASPPVMSSSEVSNPTSTPHAIRFAVGGFASPPVVNIARLSVVESTVVMRNVSTSSRYSTENSWPNGISCSNSGKPATSMPCSETTARMSARPVS